MTPLLRAALQAAIATLGEYSRAIVLTTHGHLDHIGSNDFADELGVPVERYVPVRDLEQMRDPAPYWVSPFVRVAGVVPLVASPSLAGNKVVSLFQPVLAFGATTRTYEQLPLERIRIGSTRSAGWTFAGGAVRVLRTQGDRAGHVIVHVRDNKLLHSPDDADGPCGVMTDAGQRKIHTTLGAATALLEEGEASALTDGHTLAMRDRETALPYLDGMSDQVTALHEAAIGIAADGPIRPSTVTARYKNAVTKLGIGGANPNEMFTNDGGRPAARPRPASRVGQGRRPLGAAGVAQPEPVAGMPTGLKPIPAAAMAV